jgi:hypothetical protein
VVKILCSSSLQPTCRLEKVPVNPHRLDAARIIRLGPFTGSLMLMRRMGPMLDGVKSVGYLDPLPAAAGAGPFLVGVTVLIRPFASKVNSSMHTERRKELPLESSLV